MTLEQCLEFINADELVEVTPETVRMRKRELDPAQRRRIISRSKSNKTIKFTFKLYIKVL